MRPDDLRADGTLAAGVPLLVPKPRTVSLRHHIFEGSGWTTVRLASDLTAALIAVVIVASLAESPVNASLWAYPLVLATAVRARGLYGRRMRDVVLDSIGPLVGAVSVAAMIVLAFDVFLGTSGDPAGPVGKVWLLSATFVCVGRASLGAAKRVSRARMQIGKGTLIVGAGLVGDQIARRLEEQPEYGLRPVGFLDADPPGRHEFDERSLPVLGSPSDLRGVIAETGAEHVILAFSHEPDSGMLPLVRQCDELKVEVSLVPRLFESITDRVALERLGGLPLLGLRTVDPKGWQFGIKYTLDRPGAAILLFLLWPVMLVAALAVKLSSAGPVLFRQRRVGRDGQVFDLLKFRSMRTGEVRSSFKPGRGSAPGGIEGVDRRTAVGKFLRRTAIDELPQLLNVVRGEMSLVGPRPERPEFVEAFELDHHRYRDRHRVKSGITGWAQVHNLRGQTSLADRVEWDNFYIENWSLWLDLKVLLMTLGAVVRTADDA